MSFLKRLYFFLFGLSIGIMILIFVINKKDTRFNYSPNKRVLNDIYKKEFCISPIKSLSLHLTNVNSSYGLSPFIDYKKLWDENDITNA